VKFRPAALRGKTYGNRGYGIEFWANSDKDPMYQDQAVGFLAGSLNG
jgi:hypothetical protein